jgi:hypothetical protein
MLSFAFAALAECLCSGGVPNFFGAVVGCAALAEVGLFGCFWRTPSNPNVYSRHLLLRSASALFHETRLPSANAKRHANGGSDCQLSW